MEKKVSLSGGFRRLHFPTFALSHSFSLVKHSLVLNYFNPKRNPALQRTVLFALERLVSTAAADSEIICADGSGLSCDLVSSFSKQCGVQYLPSDRAEAFAETY